MVLSFRTNCGEFVRIAGLLASRATLGLGRWEPRRTAAPTLVASGLGCVGFLRAQKYHRLQRLISSDLNAVAISRGTLAASPK